MTELDTLIRQAEMAVVETDRRWQRSAQAVVPALKASAGRATRVAGGAVVAAAALWVVLRYLRPHRPSRLPSGQPDWRHAAPRMLPAQSLPARAVRGIAELGGSLGGSLVGSILRSGLAPAQSKASLPLVFGIVAPWFKRLWNKQHSGRRTQR